MTEIDSYVQARQRAVREASAKRSKPATDVDFTVIELFDRGALASLPTRLFRAADALARDEPDGVARLVDIAREIAELDSWAEQRSTAAIQQSLDTAAAEASYAGAVVERIDRVLWATDPLGAWIAEAIQGDPVEAAARGQRLLAERIGRHGGASSGFAALFYDTVLSVIGDPEEFWRMLVEHLQLLTDARDQISALASDVVFASRLIDVTHDLWESARRAAVRPDPETLRATAEEVLEAAHLLVEQPLKFHLGIACAAATRQTFADTQAADVSALINSARDKRWAIAHNVDAASIRNAYAHRDFSVVGDHVSLSPQRSNRNGLDPVVLPLAGC